jgi:hypothetical protein
MSKRRVRTRARRRSAARVVRPAALAPVKRRGGVTPPHPDDALIPGRIHAEAKIARGPAKIRQAGAPPPRLINHTGSDRCDRGLRGSKPITSFLD